MGAAGIVEALICLQALETGLRIGSAGSPAADPAMGPLFAQQFRAEAVRAPVSVAASHSFGFGGNNCVLLFGGGPA